jgi:uncharacterized Tic20 family protein
MDPSRTASPSVAPADTDRWRLAASGRVRDMAAGDAAKVACCAIHLWPLAIALVGPFAVLVPVVLWIAFRRRSPLVDDHGREAINAQITLVALLLVPCIGWIALVPWSLAWLVSLVRAAVAAALGEIFRYPALIRLIA